MIMIQKTLILKCKQASCEKCLLKTSGFINKSVAHKKPSPDIFNFRIFLVYELFYLTNFCCQIPRGIEETMTIIYATLSGKG